MNVMMMNVILFGIVVALLLNDVICFSVDGGHTKQMKYINSQPQHGQHLHLYSYHNIVNQQQSTAIDDHFQQQKSSLTNSIRMLVAAAALLLSVSTSTIATANAVSNDVGASSAANAKLTTGGASTLQSGRTISITRGVNLDNSNFSNQNLKGVAFQQSVVRDTDFTNTNLVGSSFFDATLDGSNFNDSDMTNSNIEMAQLNRVSMKNTIARDMYVSGATLFTGIATIENSDWTDTYLRADQQKYLCQHPTAKGKNPITGVDTRESLMCKD